ncbi:hypothetical protein BDR06DRAFT_635046 [Suillus hirtellus]|nr:hypothetical protein BDR06DRAFT_635046 [Suillus hirtellus]
MGLVLPGIIVDLRGNTQHDRIELRCWQQPNGPMGNYIVHQVHNDQFAVSLGFWNTLTTTVLAHIGSDLVAVAA